MRYHNITKDDMLNGEGLRVVLWVAGCSHACEGCHNKITWNPGGGIQFDDTAKQEIFTELDKDYIDGITFSGGDPMHCANEKDVTELCKEIKEKYPDKTIWLYTGYDFEYVEGKEIYKYLDVIVDGEFQIDLLDANLEWRGSANQAVIHTKDITDDICYFDTFANWTGPNYTEEEAMHKYHTQYCVNLRDPVVQQYVLDRPTINTYDIYIKLKEEGKILFERILDKSYIKM